MAKTLFAVDELTGLITATALVRPSKNIVEVEARSVRKKMKDKAFARGVSRDDVINGAAFFNWANRLMLTLGEPEIPSGG